jgi:hypothetical protein
MNQVLKISVEDLREVSDESPDEMDVVMDMMMDADIEQDQDLALTEEDEIAGD